MVGYEQWRCLDLAKDVCFIGTRSCLGEEAELVQDSGALVIQPHECRPDIMQDLNQLIINHFERADGQTNNYWLSFDANVIESTQFKSTRFTNGEGLSMDFLQKFFKMYVPRSVGMDFSEVNFELTSGAARHNDEQTFRELIELLCHTVN